MNLTARDLRAIELLNNTKQANLPVCLEETHLYLDTLIYLHETISDLKITMNEWETFSDTLMTKFFLHCTSLLHLLKGYELQSKYIPEIVSGKKILDLPTSYVVFRCLFESYLMYNHIYVNPSNSEEKELRFLAWIHSSLKDRQTLPAKSEIAKQKKLSEREEIKILESRILNNKLFPSLTEKQQNSLLKTGNGKLFKRWNEIMKECGFKEGSTFHTYYYLLSSYAHSEGLSILQIKSSGLKYAERNGIACSILSLVNCLICKLALLIKDKYKIIEIKYNGLPQEIQDKIELTEYMMRSMNK